MKFTKSLLAVAAAALVAAPVAAQVANARASAPISAENDLGGDSEIVPALIITAIAGIAMGVLILTDDDDDEVIEPISP